jgi:sugar lactone lactonase YvrE
MCRSNRNQWFAWLLAGLVALAVGCEPPPQPKPKEPGPGAKKAVEKHEAKETPQTEPELVAPKTAPKPEPKTEAPKTEPAKTEPAAAAPKPLKKADLLVELPPSCATPDGMTLLPDQSVIVSIPNFNDRTAAPLLMKITKDNKAEEFYKLPANPDTGRFGPMGIRVAPSGDLYLADNQLFHGKDGKNLYGKSRLVRIAVKDGKPTAVVPVATRLNVANGIALHDGYVYITETILVPDSKPLVSGVFRFKFGEEGVTMKQTLRDDPHLITTLETKSTVGFGADGICFDGKGRMYVSDFSDAVIYRVILDKDGKVASKTLFAKADFMHSCDGMDYDPKTDKIYSADLMGNGVRVIDMDGKVQSLAQDADNDGSGGRLRTPCEALVRGNTIVVSNMDFPFEGTVVKKYSKPATISVIKLD